jgi:hypothetical protein
MVFCVSVAVVSCCAQGSHILTIGHALFNVSTSGISVFGNTTLISPSLTISGDRGITFHAPPIVSVKASFQLRIQRDTTSGNGCKDDWIGLVKVGLPNECVSNCVLDIDAVAKVGSESDFTVEWPSDAAPTQPGTLRICVKTFSRIHRCVGCEFSCVHPPGVYEFRYFSGLGFHNRRCISSSVVVSPMEPSKFAWLHLFDAQNVSTMSHSGQLVVAVADSKEVCTAALPTNLAMFKVTSLCDVAGVLLKNDCELMGSPRFLT